MIAALHYNLFTRWPWRVWLGRLVPPVMLIGAVYRLVGFTAAPLWYDESFSFFVARLPLAEAIRAQALDFTPPLWEMIAWVSMRVFGFNEFGLRLPALVASLVSLYLGWLLINEYSAHGTPRFWAALLAALLPYQFYLAQDGRTYAVMSALYMGSLLFAIRGRPMGLAACCGLLLWCHPTGAFYAASALALALAYHWQRWPWWLWCGAVAAASWVPWVPALIQVGSRHHWLGNLTSDLFNSGLLRVFFVNALANDAWIFPALVGIGGSIVVCALASMDNYNFRRLGLAACGPLVLMVAAAVFKNVLFYRPMSAFALPMAIWIGLVLPWAWKPVRYALGYNWLMLIAAGLIAWSPTAKGGDLRGLAARLKEPQAILYHATATSLLPFEVLLPDQTHVLLDEVQEPALLSEDLRDVFHLQRAPLEALGPGPVYVVWARDALVSTEANARLAAYIRGGVLIGTVHYWQAAPIEVYLVQR